MPLTPASGDAVVATYHIHDHLKDLAARARFMADSLTVGDWSDLSPERRSALAPHRGEVLEATEEEGFARIRIAYPVANLLPSVSALLTTVFGKLSLDGAIRLVDLELPEDYESSLGGPRLGSEGIRSRLGVAARPLLLGIFKGMWGLSLPEMANGFRELALGGCDLVKDDEIFYAQDARELGQRVRQMAEIAREVYGETGHRVLYAPNLTGPLDRLPDLAAAARDAGAGALLLSPLTMGLESLSLLERSETGLPLLAHPALAGAWIGSRTHGLAGAVLAGLLRASGADAVLFAAPAGSLAAGQGDSAVAIADRLGRSGPLRPSLPAPAAGVKPEGVAGLVELLGPDLLIGAGSAIHNHPGGSREGAAAFRRAMAAVGAS